MADLRSHECPQRGTTQALAREELAGEPRREAQHHLEDCEACRALFHDLTADRFPRLRNYTVLEKIGKGGFGVVYKVIHNAKGRIEALKLLFGRTPVRAAYFQSEVHLIARLQHPNIATLYEAHLGKMPLYYTMEFVEGRQMDVYFREQHVPLAARLEVLRTVAQAIAYAHRQGVVHRDIKPQNILIDDHGQPHLVDFGIAKRVLAGRDEAERPAPPEGALGTFGYIAPEQIAGQAVDARADVYALGALLYHVVTGEPAKFATWSEHLNHTLHQRQIARADDLAAIIGRCVAAVPERRYPTCEALARDLDDYLRGAPIRAHEHPPLAYKLARGAAYVLRNRPLAVRVTAVLALAALLAGLSYRAEARRYVSGAAPPATALVTFTEDTLQALADGRLGADLAALDPLDRKTWRVALGRLLARLAEAAPRVVACDYHLPQCQPDVDGELVAGLAALRTAHVPVIIGVTRFDLNSEPEVCPAILAAVHSYGALVSINPQQRGQEFLVTIGLKRGFAPLRPGLAVAAFAAARYPDADAEMEVAPGVVVLRYRKRHIVGQQPRWYADTDRLRYSHVDRVPAHSGVLARDDVLYLMHVRARDPDGPPVRRYDFADVLSAEGAQLREWLAGRAVVIGHTLPGMDQYLLADQRTRVFGCEVHVRALQSLLAGAYLAREPREYLALTVLLWAALGGVLVDLMPTPRTLNVRRASWGCGLAIAVGFVIVLAAARWVTDFWLTQAALALGTMATTGVAAYLLKVLRERQVQLAPDPSWATEDSTLASTMLATTGSGTPRPPARPEATTPTALPAHRPTP